jgi:hypothetical protein
VRRTEPPAIRPVDPDGDRRQLRAFSCRDFRFPYTDVIEELIRNNLADSVQAGEVSALALCSDSRICGVTAYVPDLDTGIYQSSILAVQMGYVRRGYGTQLKQAVIDIARQAKAIAVVSDVHYDNDPMINLNVKLGANVVKIPGDLEYRRCVIPLQ